MVRVLRRIQPAALVMLLIACASAGAGSGAAPDGSTTSPTSTSTRRTAGRVTPPRMLTRGAFELRGPADLRISVVVAADGQPVMGTLRVTGAGASSQQSAVEQWIRTSTFEPGRRGGAAVEALFEAQIRSSTTTRRL